MRKIGGGGKQKIPEGKAKVAEPKVVVNCFTPSPEGCQGEGGGGKAVNTIFQCQRFKSRCSYR